MEAQPGRTIGSPARRQVRQFWVMDYHHPLRCDCRIRCFVQPERRARSYRPYRQHHVVGHLQMFRRPVEDSVGLAVPAAQPGRESAKGFAHLDANRAIETGKMTQQRKYEQKTEPIHQARREKWVLV